MSPRMKEVIEAHLTGEEAVNWISCQVQAAGEQRTYYILRFNRLPDVINPELIRYSRTKKDKIGILAPCFSLEKIQRYAIFTQPEYANHWIIPTSLRVTDPLRRAIRKAKLTGNIFFGESYVA